jgi:hypothetical protein
MSEQDFERRLKQIIKADSWTMSLLEAAHDCDPPDWLIGAGVIRNLVWDHLHGYMQRTPVADVDVAFFDPDDLSPERDQVEQAKLERRLSGISWEATNQAAVHLWYEQHFGYAVPALTSSADGVGSWPETATSIGVRLMPNDELLVVAPCGLSDLFHMILRRNPRRVSVEQYRARIQAKQIHEKWPRVQIIDPGLGSEQV